MKKMPVTWKEREQTLLGRAPGPFLNALRKKMVLACLGGRCLFCGYSRAARNLAFHHVDDAAKSFGLSGRAFQQSLPSLLPELEKCVLACHNCHGEIHEGLISEQAVRQKAGFVTEQLAELKGKTWADFSLAWGDAWLHVAPVAHADEPAERS